MIDTAQRLSIAAAHAYLSRKALKRAERAVDLFVLVLLVCAMFMGVITGAIITLGYFRGWL